MGKKGQQLRGPFTQVTPSVQYPIFRIKKLHGGTVLEADYGPQQSVEEILAQHQESLREKNE